MSTNLLFEYVQVCRINTLIALCHDSFYPFGKEYHIKITYLNTHLQKMKETTQNKQPMTYSALNMEHS